jgi:dihydrofolate synthase/folylpolyglutamate synthase
MSKPSYKGAVEFLYGLETSKIKLGLERTVNLLEASGNPHHRFASIHVAGTNGKGSVACYLNSILFHNGLRTGLFTSPHLVDYRERIRVDGNVISRQELAGLVAELKAPILETEASYFEATTVLAFEYFARKAVDVGVVEVGMGGRLDSTNVLNPMLSCITSIDFDHTKYLGKTLALIAGEKAGIIKPGVPVVCGCLSKRASSVIRSIAASRKSVVLEVGKDAGFEPLRMDLRGAAFEYRGRSGTRLLELKTPGLHHVANAATALLAVDVLRSKGFEISDEAVDEGLKRAVWPGRFQVLRRRPLTICDAAHNVSGTRILVKSLEAMGMSDMVTVFGVLRDKDYARMLSLLSASSTRFVLTRPVSDRALPLVKLEGAARKLGLRFRATASVDRAVEVAAGRYGGGRPILICGSLYALGEAMAALGYRPYRVRVC